MNKKKALVIIFALLGVITAITGIVLSACFVHANPIMLKRSDAAQNQVVAMLDAVCAGDYSAAGQKMYGTPSFEAPDVIGVMLWDAFSDSLSYELVGECYPEEHYVAQKVRITCLDFSSVTEQLRPRFQQLLQQRIDQAQTVSEIYDENNNYREDVVMELLQQAAEECLIEMAQTVTVEVSVKLVYEQGQWWIVPEEELLRVITGGILN